MSRAAPPADSPVPPGQGHGPGAGHGAASGLLPAYAELHCLSNFSFQRGASHPAELVERAAELGYEALALTDECSVAGVVRAHTAARQCGLRLIVGSEFACGDVRLVALSLIHI